MSYTPAPYLLYNMAHSILFLISKHRRHENSGLTPHTNDFHACPVININYFTALMVKLFDLLIIISIIYSKLITAQIVK